jgi:hypothetical protein
MKLIGAFLIVLVIDGFYIEVTLTGVLMLCLGIFLITMQECFTLLRYNILSKHRSANREQK